MKEVGKQILICVVILTFLVTIAGIWSYWRFGNFSTILSVLRGDKLFADASSKNFGTVNRADGDKVLKFKIFNESDADVAIVGSKVKCSCVEVKDIPFKIHPHSFGYANIKIFTHLRKGDIKEFVTLYSDSKYQKEIPLFVSGFIVSKE